MIDNRLSILHLRDSNFFGGPEKQILYQLGSLNAEEFVSHVATYQKRGSDRPNEFAERLRTLGVAVSLLNDHGGLRIRTSMELLSIIDRTRADIVCCHEPKSVFLANLIRLARRNVKIVGCSRGWTHENWKVRQYERIERFLLRYVDHVVAVSHGQKAKLLQVGVPDRKITVIHNAVEMKEVHGFCQLRVELGLPVDSVLIATAGRLSPEKNHIGMIEVAQHVVSEHSKAFFLVFGEGVLRKELEERVDAAGLHGRFLLPGFRIDLPNVLRQIDIFMLPSFTEGLPNVILEAYVARKPVVATDVGGTPEIVEEGKSGFVTKPGELKKMAGHVSRLVASPELRAAFGNAGYRHVQQHFNLDLQADRYARLYGSLHNGRNAST